MYRYVIEHPTLDSARDLAKLDARAGDTMGRIYRVYPRRKPAAADRALDQLDAAGLVRRASDSPNGWQRDMASQSVCLEQAMPAVPHAEAIGPWRPATQTRLTHCVRSTGWVLGRPPAAFGVYGQNAGVRRHAVRLAEPFTDSDRAPRRPVGTRRRSRSAGAYAVGTVAGSMARSATSAAALGRLAIRHASDEYLVAAVLSSVIGEISARYSLRHMAALAAASRKTT